MNNTKEDQVKEGNSAISKDDAMQEACKFATFMRDTVISATFATLLHLGLLKAERIDSQEFRDKFVKHYDKVVDIYANETIRRMGKEVN